MSEKSTQPGEVGLEEIEPWGRRRLIAEVVRLRVEVIRLRALVDASSDLEACAEELCADAHEAIMAGDRHSGSKARFLHTLRKHFARDALA